MKTGLHLNETGNPEYFTTAYFHTPKEIIAEIAESALIFEKLISIESFGWMVTDFNKKEKDKNYMKKLSEVISMVESNEDLIAISPHIIAIARKK